MNILPYVSGWFNELTIKENAGALDGFRQSNMYVGHLKFEL